MVRSIQVKVHGRWYKVEVGDTKREEVEVMVEGERYMVEIGGAFSGSVTIPEVRPVMGERGEPTGLNGITQRDDKIIRCPMPGRIVEVSMSVGQDAQTGDEICVLETMKMEQRVLLPHDGNVLEIFIQPGDTVQAGASLMKIE